VNLENINVITSTLILWSSSLLNVVVVVIGVLVKV
jgi:hypothetical protein